MIKYGKNNLGVACFKEKHQISYLDYNVWILARAMIWFCFMEMSKLRKL